MTDKPNNEGRKRRRKRNQYRKKIVVKTNEINAIIKRMTYLKLTRGGAANLWEYKRLERQHAAVTKKLDRFGSIMTSLAPVVD